MKSSVTHLVLAVRPHAEMPYCVEGAGENEVGRFHASARDAEAAILKFCAEHRCRATVRVYTPRGHLWSVNEVAEDGTVIKTRPRWLTPKGDEAHGIPASSSGPKPSSRRAEYDDGEDDARAGQAA